jgi:hypothetical protein
MAAMDVDIMMQDVEYTSDLDEEFICSAQATSRPSAKSCSFTFTNKPDPFAKVNPFATSSNNTPLGPKKSVSLRKDSFLDTPLLLEEGEIKDEFELLSEFVNAAAVAAPSLTVDTLQRVSAFVERRQLIERRDSAFSESQPKVVERHSHTERCPTVPLHSDHQIHQPERRFQFAERRFVDRAYKTPIRRIPLVDRHKYNDLDNIGHVFYAPRGLYKYRDLDKNPHQRILVDYTDEPSPVAHLGLDGFYYKGCDTYVGPGPTREVEDSLDSLRLTNKISCSPPSEFDESLTTSSSSRYSDKMDSALSSEPRRDRQHNGRGYNGGGGGGRGRRRDFSNNQGRDRFQGGDRYQGGGDNRKRRYDDRGDDREDRRPQQKRTTYQEPIASRLRREILGVGESVGPGDLSVEAKEIGKRIADNIEDDQVSGLLLDQVVQL